MPRENFATRFCKVVGVLFNRIAGPSQTPGNFNGILIARTNTEISLADFQSSVRDFIVNVENAYWDLYYAYRELNAQTDARDAAYEVYKNAEADAAEERVSTLEKASAYEQYLKIRKRRLRIAGRAPDRGHAGGQRQRRRRIPTQCRRSHCRTATTLPDRKTHHRRIVAAAIRPTRHDSSCFRLERIVLFCIG